MKRRECTHQQENREAPGRTHRVPGDVTDVRGETAAAEVALGQHNAGVRLPPQVVACSTTRAHRRQRRKTARESQKGSAKSNCSDRMLPAAARCSVANGTARKRSLRRRSLCRLLGRVCSGAFRAAAGRRRSLSLAAPPTWWRHHCARLSLHAHRRAVGGRCSGRRDSDIGRISPQPPRARSPPTLRGCMQRRQRTDEPWVHAAP